jgi:hypothetical protein
MRIYLEVLVQEFPAMYGCGTHLSDLLPGYYDIPCVGKGPSNVD